MEKIKKIVVPVDFSTNTDKLVDYALYMGKSLSAKLVFIHAVSLYGGDAMFSIAYPADYKATFVDDARERMENLVADVRDQCPDCKGEVVVGEPTDEIVRFAKSTGADMIVISTHGAKGLEKILLGSVAERVVHRAHCPVLVMNPFRKAAS